MDRLNQRLQNLIQALEFEKQYELTEYNVDLKFKTIKDKVKEGKTLYPLNYLGVKLTKFGDSVLEFEINEKQNVLKFTNGSLIELFNIDNEKEQGQVFYATNHKLGIKININEIEDWFKKGKIGLNLLPDTKTYDTYLNQLSSISEKGFEANIKSIYSENIKINTSKASIKSNVLNQSQIKAVNSVVNNELLTTIIHGPPGTGKTTTLVNSIIEIVNQKKRIIVCAPTNTAVDNICQKLINKKLKVCRIGNPVKVESSILNYTLDGLAKNDTTFKFVEQLKKQAEQIRKKAFKFKRNFGKQEHIERKQLKKELNAIKKDIKRYQKNIYANILENVDVVCGTFVGVLNENLGKTIFDYLVIDEAGQTIEPAIWAVSHLACNLVLAGDNYQLPPFVQSKKAIELGLNVSILEQIKDLKYPTSFLDTQYRMNDKIMMFSNHYFYSSELKSSPDVKNWTLNIDAFETIEFIDTAGCGFEEQQNELTFGLKNDGETAVVKKRLKELNVNLKSEITLGIISPYRYQIKTLQLELPYVTNNINTIDGFQGQERDCIIISLVRCNSSNEIGFLKDYRRMNVAMTRAKKKLIIIGDSATLGNDVFYNKMLNYIEKTGSYRSAWEFMD